MGTVETYKSTTPPNCEWPTGASPASMAGQRSQRFQGERTRERAAQASDRIFSDGSFGMFFGAKTKRHNSEFNASLITQIRCTLFVHVFIVSGLEGSEIRPTPRREHRERRSREKVQWQTYAFDHRASIKICVAWFSTLPGMRCQNHKAIGFLKGNTLLWFSWECRNHHDRAPLHAQNTKFAKLMGKVTRKFCGLKKSEQVSAVALVWVTFCRYVTCIHYTCITRSCFHSIHRL